jgi:adenine-specific DNA-methyltransferase
MLLSYEEKLKALLWELFQLDKSDLDFGIYRVMNILGREMKEFINHTLDDKLEEIRHKLAVGNRGEVEDEIKLLHQQLSASYGEDYATWSEEYINDPRGIYDDFREKFPRYQRLQQQLEAFRVSDEVVADIYNDLYRFFERYYEEGDFIARPRAGSNTYMIPYNGEEVTLYWATQDQYYIKTGENFRNYSFHNGRSGKERVTVEFLLIDAQTSLNNNHSQKGRLFIPTEDYFKWLPDENKLNLYFYYKVPGDEEKERWGSKQSVKTDNKGINQRLLLDLEEKIKATDSLALMHFWEQHNKIVNGEPTHDFTYHLQRYVNVNSFDYFIHKNLKGFLTRELDYFLKNDVIKLDFLNPGWKAEQAQTAMKRSFVRATAVKELALFVIDFMAMFEEFQKMLFEKKKMVVQSDYCLTLDMIDEAIYEEIVNAVLSDPGQKQLKIWKELGFIDNLDIEVQYIKEHNKLVLDTQYLSRDLKDRLLATFEDLDRSCGGLMIESENWQALTLLLEKYKKRISGIYIDPPYNADATEIVYKNGYKDSSWCSLIYDRMVIAKELLHEDAVACTTIDEYEVNNLAHVIDKAMKGYTIRPVIIEYNHRGRVKSNIAVTHEYALWAIPQGKDLITRKRETSEDIRRNLRRTGTDSTRQASPRQFYGIEVDNDTLAIVNVTEPLPLGTPIPEHGDHKTTMVWPVDDQGIERRWYYGSDRVLAEAAEGTVWAKRIRGDIQIHYHQDGKPKMRKSVWVGTLLDASTYGSELLNDIFGMSRAGFSFPKSIYAVKECLEAISYNSEAIFLDYFAGSGTTGHAVINLNREDNSNGQRKYILVEMGEYFESVLKQRIQKVMYSNNWRNGKPQDMGGISHMFQYLRLEQYEDSLNNMEFALDTLEKAQVGLALDQRLLYLLTRSAQTSDCILNVEKFEHPFDYTLDITRYNQRHRETVDLVTTFNYFIGLSVRRILIENHQNRRYKIVLGNKGAHEHAIIWRDYDLELDEHAERLWIEAQPWYHKHLTLYANAGNAFGAHMIENEFIRRMFAGVAGDYYVE